MGDSAFIASSRQRIYRTRLALFLQPKRVKKQTNVRGWLANRLGFDLLAYDDFLGGVVLLAPNPVARGVGTYIKETLADGSERLGVRATLRQGADVNTLRVRLRRRTTGRHLHLGKRPRSICDDGVYRPRANASARIGGGLR